MYKHKYLVLHCCFSYHALLELHNTDKWNKLAAAKKQAEAEGISVWEVKQCLDADLLLDEYSQCKAGGFNALSSYKGCLHMLKWQGRRSSNGLFAMATSNLTLGWTLRWRSQPFSWWGLKPPGMRFRNSTMMFTNWEGHQALHHMVQNVLKC